MQRKERSENEPPRGFFSSRETSELVSLSRTTLWRLAKVGKFPRPVQLTGARAVGYRREQVEAWIADPSAWRPDGGAGSAADAAGEAA